MNLIKYWTTWNTKREDLLFWFVLLQANILLGFKFFTGLIMGVLIELWVKEKLYYCRKKTKVEILLESTGVTDIIKGVMDEKE